MQRIKQNRQREAVTSGDKTNKVEPRRAENIQIVNIFHGIKQTRWNLARTVRDKRSLSEQTKGLCQKNLIFTLFKQQNNLSSAKDGIH
jgi:hypothetical protein